MKGLVTKIAGSNITVKTEKGHYLDCVVKGNFRIKGIKSTSPVAVGDRVCVNEIKDQLSYIEKIEERKNYLVRKPTNLSRQKHILAANIDQAILIATIKSPKTNTTFIDRFLASAEAYRIKSIIIFNKTDLLEKEDLETLDELYEIYTKIGYQCLKTSALKNEGIEDIKRLLKNKISLISGNSGVGKSTIINKIDSTFAAKTGIISTAHHKGMHTTTYSEMYEIPQINGFIIDTPGIKGFGTVDFEKGEIASYFPEIFKISASCKFNNCTHTHEPECAVLKAIKEGKISKSRYISYLSIIDDKEENKYREKY